jgi:small GTP-binding protein
LLNIAAEHLSTKFFLEPGLHREDKLCSKLTTQNKTGCDSTTTSTFPFLPNTYFTMPRPQSPPTSHVIAPPPTLPSSLEAKLVVLGSQGVGKTSLVNRFISPSTSLSHHSSSSTLAAPQSTIGASFHTKRVLDPDTSTTVRLQIWDTAGQERFRSISRLYYRGANAGLLCYDITNEASWEDMKGWLRELKAQCGDPALGGEGLVIHVVGTKSDIVAEDPSRRKVPFERTIAYVAEQLYPSQASTPPTTAMGLGYTPPNVIVQSPDSKRSSGFWGQDVGWDSCHEVNAKDGEGIEEVFRVIARKLVEQRNRRVEREEKEMLTRTPGYDGPGSDYFMARGIGDGSGSFRIGMGDKRKSWLGLPAALSVGETGEQIYEPQESAKRKGKCC